MVKSCMSWPRCLFGIYYKWVDKQSKVLYNEGCSYFFWFVLMVYQILTTFGFLFFFTSVAFGNVFPFRIVFKSTKSIFETFLFHSKIPWIFFRNSTWPGSRMVKCLEERRKRRRRGGDVWLRETIFLSRKSKSCLFLQRSTNTMALGRCWCLVCQFCWRVWRRLEFVSVGKGKISRYFPSQELDVARNSITPAFQDVSNAPIPDAWLNH